MILEYIIYLKQTFDSKISKDFKLKNWVRQTKY